MDCPICGAHDAQEFAQPMGDWLDVNCPRCGKYRIGGTAAATLPGRPSADRMMTSAHVRHAGLAQREVPVVSSTTVDAARDRAAILSVSDKQNELLLGLSRQSKYPGYAVPFFPHVDHVLAWAETPEELKFHFETLKERGLVREPNNDPICVVTAKGWSCVAELMVPGLRDSPEVFVAMSFAGKLAPAWTDGLAPGIAEAGYRPVRVDSDKHNDRIDTRIMGMIRRARFVVADVTLQNRGAYFEAGFALGLNKPVVWSVRDKSLKNVHFDSRQFNHVVWLNPADLRTKIRDHIVGVFGQGPVPPGKN